jgi:UDPglucose--hexose-1-phosphate uridylyltransferase
MNEYAGKWEQRWHPLRQEWVVYSAHRNARPWSGDSVKPTEEKPSYDPKCYLCPRNERAGGIKNPDYTDVYIFDNDFPVVGPNAPDVEPTISTANPFLYKKKRANGLARVVCYDPRHNVHLAQIPSTNVARVFSTWRDQMIEFRKNPDIHFVLIFENRGEIVGVSNPHPHCQIYATNFTFQLVNQELHAAHQFANEHGKNIFDEIIDFELKSQVRIIYENEHACAFIPFFARYAYEMMIFPKKRHATLATMSDEEIHGLAETFQQVVRRYDCLYDIPFPYVMSILQAPVDSGDYSDYHFHLFIQPPLRQPGLQKFPAGPEIGGGNFMSDTIPEEKALELKQVDLSMYKEVEG